MWYYKLFIFAIIVLAALYYLMVVLHCFGLISITDKEVKFIKAVVPFYYWIKG